MRQILTTWVDWDWVNRLHWLASFSKGHHRMSFSPLLLNIWLDQDIEKLENFSLWGIWIWFTICEEIPRQKKVLQKKPRNKWICVNSQNNQNNAHQIFEIFLCELVQSNVHENINLCIAVAPHLQTLNFH